MKRGILIGVACVTAMFAATQFATRRPIAQACDQTPSASPGDADNAAASPPIDSLDLRPCFPAAPAALPAVLFGPRGPVFNHSENARRIAFVCDASGSMSPKMASLKNQLCNAVLELRATQGFSLIFFQDKDYATLSGELLPATKENKRKAVKFLDVTVTSDTDPIPGLELAFKQKPRLIYLLADGYFPDNDAVLKKCRELNKGKQVRINTVFFTLLNDEDTSFAKFLREISDESGGVYTRIDETRLDNN